jgi:hypothetical protein
MESFYLNEVGLDYSPQIKKEEVEISPFLESIFDVKE